MESETIMLFATLALWSAGFLLAGRLRPCSVVRRSDLASAPSVIIPARNEEHNLPALLRSLASQPVKPREISWWTTARQTAPLNSPGNSARR